MEILTVHIRQPPTVVHHQMDVSHIDMARDQIHQTMVIRIQVLQIAKIHLFVAVPMIAQEMDVEIIGMKMVNHQQAIICNHMIKHATEIHQLEKKRPIPDHRLAHKVQMFSLVSGMFLNYRQAYV